MKILKNARLLVLALLLPVVSATAAHAGVFISVTVAPPILPVYEQPPCPEPGLMWTPGYWAYDYDAQSYYWVPGAWVPAPYEGALWTPPYWGWSDGVYMFHPGYWGTEVGYYGGVNYGWGYMGIGFIGGRWHERHFEYNEAVVHVNRTYVHETYIDRTVIREHVVDERHVAYAGGPGGVHHEPLPEERRAMQAPHVAPTQYQQQHMQQARTDRQSFYNVNHGRPQNVALARPLPAQHVAPPPAARGGAQVNGNAGFHNNNQPAITGNAGARGGMQEQPGRPQQPGQQQPNQQHGLMGAPAQNNNRPQNQNRPAEPGMIGVPSQRGGPAAEPTRPTPTPQYRPAPQEQNRPQPQVRPEPQARPEPQNRPEPQYRPAPQPQARPVEPQYHPQPQARPEPQSRPEPQFRPAPQQRPAPEARPAPAPRPAPQARPEPREKEHK